MFNFLPLYIALRYTHSGHKNRFISFIAFISILGIALGVAVLITVLSVMNGYDYEIKKRLLIVARQITVQNIGGNIENWESASEHIRHIIPIRSIAPFVNGQGMIMYEGQANPIWILGILPSLESTVSGIDQKMQKGYLKDLKAGSFSVILGEKLANNLGVGIGDKILLLIPVFNLTPNSVMPRYKSFTVQGIFKVGNGFDYDSQLALIHLKDAQALFQLNHTVTGLRISLDNLYAAPRMANILEKALFPSYQVTDWTQDFGAFFNAVKLEKTIIFFMLVLIIAVAAFNQVATLVMVVQSKKSDIAILRTIGMTARRILWIFLLQGFLIGLIGTALGLIFGLLLASHLTSLVSCIEHFFHIQLISSDVYYIDYLPSKIEIRDLYQVCGIAFTMSVLGTLYPAWRAARVHPAEALRYE